MASPKEVAIPGSEEEKTCWSMWSVKGRDVSQYIVSSFMTEGKMRRFVDSTYSNLFER